MISGAFASDNALPLPAGVRDALNGEAPGHLSVAGGFWL
jgi:hypothetical protein